MIFLNITLPIVSLALILIIIYFLVLVRPPKKTKPDKALICDYVHRGLHGKDAPENSLAAFENACKAGYGIELDVQLSRDGVVMVFHDYSLLRMTGCDKKLAELDSNDLSGLFLDGSDQTIPTFSQVLDLVDGAVPMLIEIKQGSGESGIAEKFIEVIEGYKGDYIVESFHPFALRIVKKARPDILRGILAYEYMKDERYKGKIIFRLSQNLELNFLSRPDFISYDHNGHAVPKMKLVHRLFKTPLIAWTVRSQEEENAAREHGFSAVIFENYIPER